jgi:hypothetical protein
MNSKRWVVGLSIFENSLETAFGALFENAKVRENKSQGRVSLNCDPEFSSRTQHSVLDCVHGGHVDVSNIENVRIASVG